MLRYLFALAALVALPLPALAYNCDAVVDDQAGWFGDRTNDVQKAANDLIQAGADVRVVTLKETTNLDVYKANEMQSCSSWQSADGGMHNSLIVFMAAPHKVGIYYGDMWRPAFKDGAQAGVYAQYMTPKFRDGDFAGGFILGMNRVKEMVDAQMHPATASAPVVIEQGPAVDYSGTWKMFLWIIIGVVAFVVSFLAMRAYASARAAGRKEAEDRDVAQRAAIASVSACSSAINGFEDSYKALEAGASAVQSAASEETASALARKLAALKGAQASAAAEFARIASPTGRDPNEGGLSAKAYQKIQQLYDRFQVDMLDKVEEQRKKLATELDELERSAKEAPSKVAAAQAALTKAESSIADVKTKGFKTGGAEASLAEAKGFLEEAQKQFAGKKLGAAATLADKASKKAGEASQAAEGLSQRKSALDASMDELDQRGKSIVSRLSDAKAVFGELSATYAPQLWQNVAGNGTEAEKRVSGAVKKLAEARTAASMDFQDWERSKEALDQGDALLDEADDLLKSITGLRDALAQAKAKAQTEIDEAQADIKKATAYLKRYGSDVSASLQGDLARASALLEEARKELAKEKPDYPQVVKKALAANQAADLVFEHASGEHEAAERKRRQAASLLEEAERSIGEAERYVTAHRSDVRTGPKSDLSRAKAEFALARAAKSLDEQIRHAKAADTAADEALATAKRNVQAEEARIRRERDDDNNSLATGIILGEALSSSSGRSSSWGHRRNDDDSSGSFGSWGGSSSGGGSLGDFGGSSSGGGSSDSW